MSKEFKPTGFSETIFKERYAVTPDETFEGMCERVADQMALAEAPDKKQIYKDKFKEILKSNLFVPGGRILYHSGRNNPQLLNCFVLSKELDSKEGWGNIAKEVIVTSMTGGGCGIDFSDVRPFGSPINGQKGICPGPVSLMNLIDNCAEPIRSGGQRRVALMFSLDLDHPDVEYFIDEKLKNGKLTHANVSIRSNDTAKFIKAVKEDTTIELNWKGQFKKDISAKGLWNKIVTNAYNSAEPGFLNWEFVSQENNLYYRYDLTTTNPCVTGDTPILTDKGYIDIEDTVGKSINIWNGKEWSEVTPCSTGPNNIRSIQLSDGSSLKCTDYHKFILAGGIRVCADELKIGDRLEKFQMPVVETGVEYPIDAYSQGFYSGDGTTDYTYSWLYSTKYTCEERLMGTFGNVNGNRKTWKHGPMMEKTFVPINGTLKYCLNWLAGLCDSDGTVTNDTNGNGIQICSIDKKFLLDVKLMLTRMGCRAKVVSGDAGGNKYMPDGRGGSALYPCQQSYRLLLGNQDTYDLSQLGLITNRLELHNIPPQRDARRFVTVVNVDECQDLAPIETFCFNESKNNSGTFNGIVTGQCGEQALPEYGNCCLGHLVLFRFVKDADIDWNLLANTIRTAVRFLDNVLSVNSYPLHEMREKALKERRIGLGATGLADMLAMLNLKYGSAEANKFIDKLFRFISKIAYESSVMLSVEKGPFPLCDPEKHIESGYMKRMTNKIKALVLDHGIRNCCILTIAPTGTVSILSDNCSSGIEPMFAPAYERRFWKDNKREVELVFHPLFSKFLKEGKGTEHFVGARDITVRDHLEVQKVVQRHIDSAVSKTINIPQDYSIEDMSSMWLEYLPYLKGTTFYRENTRGYVNEKGEMLEPPLVALTLEDARNRFMDGKYIEDTEQDCPNGVCAI